MVAQVATGVRWTVRDLEVLPKNEWSTYEIIDGELFATRSPHRRHQQAGGKIYAALDAWSVETGLGEAISAPGIVLSEADNVIPDAVWASNERLAVIEDDSGHLTELPELMIEVLSPGAQNIRRDREAKLKLYSVQGAQEYWIADRFSKQIEVYRREGAKLVLTATLLGNDVLESPLLPGFACDISEFFV